MEGLGNEFLLLHIQCSMTCLYSALWLAYTVLYDLPIQCSMTYQYSALWLTMWERSRILRWMNRLRPEETGVDVFAARSVSPQLKEEAMNAVVMNEGSFALATEVCGFWCWLCQCRNRKISISLHQWQMSAACLASNEASVNEPWEFF